MASFWPGFLAVGFHLPAGPCPAMPINSPLVVLPLAFPAGAVPAGQSCLRRGYLPVQGSGDRAGCLRKPCIAFPVYPHAGGNAPGKKEQHRLDGQGVPGCREAVFLHTGVLSRLFRQDRPGGAIETRNKDSHAPGIAGHPGSAQPGRDKFQVRPRTATNLPPGIPFGHRVSAFAGQ